MGVPSTPDDVHRGGYRLGCSRQEERAGTCGQAWDLHPCMGPSKPPFLTAQPKFPGRTIFGGKGCPWKTRACHHPVYFLVFHKANTASWRISEHPQMLQGWIQPSKLPLPRAELCTAAPCAAPLQSSFFCDAFFILHNTLLTL